MKHLLDTVRTACCDCDAMFRAPSAYATENSGLRKVDLLKVRHKGVKVFMICDYPMMASIFRSSITTFHRYTRLNAAA